MCFNVESLILVWRDVVVSALGVSTATLHRAQLVLGWMTVFGRTNHLGVQRATQANSVSYPMRDGK